MASSRHSNTLYGYVFLSFVNAIIKENLLLFQGAMILSNNMWNQNCDNHRLNIYNCGGAPCEKKDCHISHKSKLQAESDKNKQTNE